MSVSIDTSNYSEIEVDELYTDDLEIPESVNCRISEKGKVANHKKDVWKKLNTSGVIKCEINSKCVFIKVNSGIINDISLFSSDMYYGASGEKW